MREIQRKYEENLEFEVYRNTPFQFVATAESEPRMNIATTTVTRPKGSWIIVEATQHSIPTFLKLPTGALK
jgi:hypothetical protein